MTTLLRFAVNGADADDLLTLADRIVDMDSGAIVDYTAAAATAGVLDQAIDIVAATRPWSQLPVYVVLCHAHLHTNTVADAKAALERSSRPAVAGLATQYLQMTHSWAAGNRAVWSAILDLVNAGTPTRSLHRLLTVPHHHNFGLGVTERAPDDLLDELVDAVIAHGSDNADTRSDIDLIETAARLGRRDAVHQLLDYHQIRTIGDTDVAATALPCTVAEMPAWASHTDPGTYRDRVDLLAQHDPAGVCRHLDEIVAAIRPHHGTIADELAARHNPQIGDGHLTELLEQCASRSAPHIDDVVTLCGEHRVAAAGALSTLFANPAVDVVGAASSLRSEVALHRHSDACHAAILRRRHDDADTIVAAHHTLRPTQGSIIDRLADYIDLADTIDTPIGTLYAAAINQSDGPPAPIVNDLAERGLLDDDAIGSLRGATVERLSRRWPDPAARARIGAWIRDRIGIDRLPLADELAGALTLDELVATVGATRHDDAAVAG